MKKGNKLKCPEGAGGGKGEPPVPPKTNAPKKIDYISKTQ